jgi:hypothetical protein
MQALFANESLAQALRQITLFGRDGLPVISHRRRVVTGWTTNQHVLHGIAHQVSAAEPTVVAGNKAARWAEPVGHNDEHDRGTDCPAITWSRTAGWVRWQSPPFARTLAPAMIAQTSRARLRRRAVEHGPVQTSPYPSLGPFLEPPMRSRHAHPERGWKIIAIRLSHEHLRERLSGREFRRLFVAGNAVCGQFVAVDRVWSSRIRGAALH